VIGSGQSALESAALLHESGAESNRSRARQIHWLGGIVSKTITLVWAPRSRSCLCAHRRCPPDQPGRGAADLVRRCLGRFRTGSETIDPALRAMLVRGSKTVPVNLAVRAVRCPGCRRIKVQLNDGSERTIAFLLERAIEWTVSVRFPCPGAGQSISRFKDILGSARGSNRRSELHFLGAPAVWSSAADAICRRTHYSSAPLLRPSSGKLRRSRSGRRTTRRRARIIPSSR